MMARLELERPALHPLPERRTTDYEETIVTVTSTSGFTLRKVFYSVPSRLIGHRLRVRLYDDGWNAFSAPPADDAAPRPAASQRQARPRRRLPACHPRPAPQTDGFAQPRPSPGQALVYREQLFPRRAYQRAFEALLAADGEEAGVPHHGRAVGPGA